jgi:hypothetical protein
MKDNFPAKFRFICSRDLKETARRNLLPVGSHAASRLSSGRGKIFNDISVGAVRPIRNVI